MLTNCNATKIHKAFFAILLAAVIIVALCACSNESPVFSLDAPDNLRIEQGVLKWDRVEKADEYVLYINGKQVVTKATSYSELEAGNEYEISVVARNVWTTSNASETLFATVLSVPENFVYFNGRFYFDDVPNASSYVILVDGEEYEVKNDEEAYFEFYEAGTKQAQIRAKGDNARYFDSPYSSEMPVRVENIPWETIASKQPKGKGTSRSPYKIESVENLKWLTLSVKDNYMSSKGVFYELSQDLDMRFISGFEPIGTSDQPFLGSFDGNNHSIYYLHVTANKAGIFGCVGEGAEITDLSNVGGKVKGYTTAGGIAASNLGLIMGCKNTSSVEGNTAGGIVAENTDSKLILSCENSGEVSGENVGGIAGWNWNGTINLCKNSGKITAVANGGGIVGTNAGSVFYCENSGSINAKNAGGIANSNIGVIKSVVNGGFVIGQKSVGGIVATNNGTIKYAYNTGFVECDSDYSDRYVGGIVGNLLDGKLILCYNVNYFSDTTARSVGRMVGYYRSGLLQYCYYIQGNLDETPPVGNTNAFIGSSEQISEEALASKETVDLFNSLVDKEDVTILTTTMFKSGGERYNYPIFYWQ